MGTPDASLCVLGAVPATCACEHVAARVPKGREGDRHNRLCPCHEDHKASLSINAGKIQRIVWHCGAGCDPADIRAALLDLGADPSCLGRYGTPKREVQPGMRIVGHEPGLVADAKRWHAALKLPPDLNGKLMRMCLQAIAEGDGDLPGDPFRLLPVLRDEFIGLAARSGIEHSYRYRLYKQWLQQESG